jgi:hypothetical protein
MILYFVLIAYYYASSASDVIDLIQIDHVLSLFLLS